MTTPEVEAQEEETFDIVLEGWVGKNCPYLVMFLQRLNYDKTL